MPEAKVEFRTVAGYLIIRLEGEFKVSTLNYIHLIANGASEEGDTPIIIDASGTLAVSDEIKKMECSSPVDWLGDLVLVIVGPHERLNTIKQILGMPHQLRYAPDIAQAIKELNNLGS